MNPILAIFVGVTIGIFVTSIYILYWVSKQLNIYRNLLNPSVQTCSYRVQSPTKPYKIIIAGNYGQFHNWVNQYVINAYSHHCIEGKDKSRVEFIKVGDWQNSPVIDILPDYVEDWQEFLGAPVY